MLASEFRRGLNAFNLTVGAIVSMIVGIAVFALTRARILPLLTNNVLTQSLLAAGALFLLITGMHGSIHTYFGWRFGRGIRACKEGRHAEAVRLLSIVQRGMEHYDPDGLARQALKESKQTLK